MKTTCVKPSQPGNDGSGRHWMAWWEPWPLRDLPAASEINQWILESGIDADYLPLLRTARFAREEDRTLFILKFDDRR